MAWFLERTPRPILKRVEAKAAHDDLAAMIIDLLEGDGPMPHDALGEVRDWIGAF